jgi:hypothetical protein
LKMWEDSAQNFGDKELFAASRQRTVSHFIFHEGISDQKQHTCRTPPTLFSFLGLNIKLRGSHFDTTEGIEAESKAVLNTLREHDFQDAFKKWQKSWERFIRAEEDWTARRVMMASRTRVSFGPDRTTRFGNYGWCIAVFWYSTNFIKTNFLLGIKWVYIYIYIYIYIELSP